MQCSGVRVVVINFYKNSPKKQCMVLYRTAYGGTIQFIFYTMNLRSA